MTDLHRAIQGIHIRCPRCECLKTGAIVIHNDDETGITLDISVVCLDCGSKVRDLELPHKKKKTEQEVLND